MSVIQKCHARVLCALLISGTLLNKVTARWEVGTQQPETKVNYAASDSGGIQNRSGP